MSRTTVIKNCDWVIGWDRRAVPKAAGGHVYLKGADIAFRDHELIHVGKGFQGEADVTLDGAGKMVMPGFIDVHSHPASEPGNKGLNEELARPSSASPRSTNICRSSACCRRAPARPCASPSTRC